MIIAVNITKTIKTRPSIIDCTRHHWKLKIQNCNEHEYVIGVVNGQVKECFKKLSTHQSPLFPDRVEFDLAACTVVESLKIKNYIQNNNIKLGHFVVKYIP